MVDSIRPRFIFSNYCSTNSTRRLRARPASSALLATGAKFALPLAIKRLALMRCGAAVRALTTACARCKERLIGVEIADIVGVPHDKEFAIGLGLHELGHFFKLGFRFLFDGSFTRIEEQASECHFAFFL